MAAAFVSATLRFAGVRFFWPALKPMGSRMSSLLRRWASFESLISSGDWLPSPTQMTRHGTRVIATAETDRSSGACCPSSCTKMHEAPTCSAISMVNCFKGDTSGNNQNFGSLDSCRGMPTAGGHQLVPKNSKCCEDRKIFNRPSSSMPVKLPAWLV